jgi:DNA-binding transcriptional LysR family regulator
MAAEQSDASKGVINIQATLSVAIKVLGPAMRTFAARFPDVSFNLNMCETPSRVIDSGYDIVMIHRPTSREKKVACRTLRPVLQTLGIEHFGIERLEDVEFVVDSMAKHAFATQAPAAIILSPLLTKGR